MAILTDGQEWSFYLPGETGHYAERRVYKLVLLGRSVGEAARQLERYPDYHNVCSGAALKAARTDYQDISRGRIIEKTMPGAWKELLEEQDSLLLDLLSEKVETISGFKPDPEVCGEFLERQLSVPGRQDDGISRRSGQTGQPVILISPPAPGSFVFHFKGERQAAGSAREMMSKIFQLLAAEDQDFLERFASCKHGRKRRYLAMVRQDLYPGRPDLAEHHSVEIVPGWWLGTNYSRRNISEIIQLALEVAGPRLGALLKVSPLGKDIPPVAAKR